MLTKRIWSFLITAVFLVFVGGTVGAQENQPMEDWEFSAHLYMWYASIGGDSVDGSRLDVGADDVIDALDLATMSVLELRRGKWFFLADVIYLVVSDDQDIMSILNVDVQLKSWIVTPAVGYILFQNETVQLDLLIGARYLYMKTNLTLDLDLPNPFKHHRRKFSLSEHVWDGIVGTRGRVGLTKNFFIPFYLDVGTGDSDLTWQALAGIGYSYNSFEFTLGYRYLAWEFDDAILEDLNISGPYAGVKFRF
jgi:hypothetical protein